MSMSLTPKGGPGAVETRGQFDLKDLGVRPGDKIEYFFEAVDNDPAGPNVVTSSIFAVEIISVEQYTAILRSMMAQRALFERHLALSSQLRRMAEQAEVLEEHQRRLRRLDGGTANQRKALSEEAAALRASLAEYQKALEDALNTSPLFDIEQAFQDSLREQLPNLERLLKEMDDLAGDASGAGLLMPRRISDISDILSDMAGQTEREVGEPARQIAAVAHLLARADVFARLAARQMELARLLRRFEEREGELTRIEQMELQELAAAEQRIRDAVARLMEELPELTEALPEEEQFDTLRESVADFMEAVSDLKIQDDLDEAADKLAELDGPGGYPPAKSAADKMDLLVAKLDGNAMMAQGQSCLRFQPGIRVSLGNTLQQIRSAMQSRGMGGDGGSGYGLYGQEMGLYGPDVQLAGTGAAVRPVRPHAEVMADGQEAIATDAADAGLPEGTGPLRIRLRRDVKFPLRHRNLVGEYFRAVAESLQ
jgi:hypothetical protein